MASRILIVEDEPALLAILEAAMQFGGFDYQSVSSGGEALSLIASEPFDAVLLDLGLPDVDGKRLLQTFREISNVPIVICSGQASERDKIEALDLGADDFIAKPFLPGEMLARIRAVIRRRSGLPVDETEIDQAASAARGEDRWLVLDPAFSVARFGDREIHLSRSEFIVLKLLIEENHGPVSRAAITEALYGEGEERQTKIVEIYLMRLRRKLKDLTGRDDLIENFRGRGWALRGED